MRMSNKHKSLQAALIIVDMQADFLDRAGDDCGEEAGAAASKKLMAGVLREVKEAMRKRLPIVCLTYTDQDDGFEHPAESWAYHATDEAIRKALKGYTRAYYALKDTDDGSEEVTSVLEGVEPRRGMDKPSYRGKPNKLRKFITDGHSSCVDFTVVGVNASACVAATCEGLVDCGHICHVPADAAMDVWGTCPFADESARLDDINGVRITNMKRAAAA